jgi:DNA-directed RNA polymerase subunit RPC12/RpoP
MAQKIVTTCDPHEAEGKDVDGQTWTLTITGPGVKPQTWTVDLCGQHTDPITEVQRLLTEHGRKDGGVRAARAIQTGPPAATATAVDSLTCPECGYVGNTRKALRDHTRRSHEKTLGELTGDAGDYTCPECSRKFDTPQGRGAHRFRTHGVRGSGD